MVILNISDYLERGISMKNTGIQLDPSLQDDTKLYRYITVSQFISMIENEQIYLTNIQLWEDIWELPTQRLNYKEQLPTLFGQCWSLEGISDALWRIYSPMNEGILIQTSVAKIKSFSEIQIGLVAPVLYYHNLEEVAEIIKNNKGYHRLFTQGLLKRKAFQHEQEVRVITSNDSKCISTRAQDNRRIYIQINPRELIEDIVIDPRANDWFVEAMRKYCRRIGFHLIPKRSDLV